MSDVVFAALIGVGGSVIVALVSLFLQKSNTENILKIEAASRINEKRIDRLIDRISELLVYSDPQSTGGVDYGKTTNLIVQVQLLLNIENDLEASLSYALNELGACLHDYYPIRHEYIDKKLYETKSLLEAHSKVIEESRRLLNNNE